MNIPFKKNHYDAASVDLVNQYLSGNIDAIGRAAWRLSKTYGEHILLTSSASAAFELLFAALAFPPGGEVILPSFTYPSAANTVLRSGLKPVFAEISGSTMVLDLHDVRRKITDKTCGVVPTHYGGASPDMDALRTLCGDIPVIEDAALSFGATYKGKPLGTVGNYGIISFHHTKNISADQGGMLVMNTAGPAIRQRIQTLYDNGTNRAAFLAGEADAYTWQMPGLGVSIPGMAAALLAGQLQSGDAIQAAHRTVWECYMDNLSGADGLQLPHIPAYNQNNCHVFYILLENTHIREHVRSGLAGKGIQAHFHYMPLHASAMGAQLGYKPEDLPVTMNAAERLLRLPIYAGLSEQECAAVCAAVREALA